jgi:hypothetical protein
MCFLTTAHLIASLGLNGNKPEMPRFGWLANGRRTIPPTALVA